jgi:hypothetical protein
MRTFLAVLALATSVTVAAQPAAKVESRIERPGPSHCCVDKVYDAKSKLLGDLLIYDTYHRVSWASVRYTIKGGDSVALLVTPWSIMTDLQPAGSNVLFASSNCTGDALVIFGNYPQLMKRQAVVLNVGTYPQYFPSEAWLYVSDPFPLPLTSLPAGTVFHSQWEYGACSPYPAPGYTPSGFLMGAVWVHRTEDLLNKYTRPFWIP